MVKIDISWPEEDDWLKWRKACEAEKKALKVQVREGNKPTVKDLYKKKQIKDKYYFGVDGLFNGKCAYCETFLRDFQRGDIEHFRPKLGVTDENDQPIEVDYGNGPEEHIGYYWMCYDKTNLLPSCVTCNQATKLKDYKIGKHNRFPVMGDYAIDESGIGKEQPLLINPIVDDPAKYIGLETEGRFRGFLKGLDGEDRGEMTIKILGLNLRDQLVERRQGKMNEVRAKLVTLIMGVAPDAKEKIIRELTEMRNGKGEYSLAVVEVLREHQSLFMNL